jgi:hypothetical protein
MKENAISWSEILTACVALYGAILSSIIFVKEQQKNKRKIDISLSIGELLYSDGLIETDQVLYFTISNPGNRKVTVSNPQLLLKNKKKIFFPDNDFSVRFPYSLEDGKNIMIWYKLPELKKSLVEFGYTEKIEIKGVIEEQTGNKFFTKKWMEIKL